MTKDELTEATKAISMMLSAFPSSHSRITEDTARAYRFVAEEFSLEAVKRTCRAFVKGEVADVNAEFAPSTAKFAQVCRELAGQIMVEQYEAERQFVEIGSPLWQQLCMLRGVTSLPSSNRGGLEGWLFTKDEIAQAGHVLLPPPVSEGQQQINAVRAKQLIARAGASFSVGDPDGNLDAGEAA